jgi:isoleucyl-tRNA synthetase
MGFKKVDPKQSFPKMEEEILKFWEENKIFEKSVEKNSTDKSFIFYEGPPTANGKFLACIMFWLGLSKM